jgi:hypothetical protein
MIAPINSMLVALAGPTDRTFEFSVEFRLRSGLWYCTAWIYQETGATPEQALEKMHTHLRALSEEKLDKLQKALS